MKARFIQLALAALPFAAHANVLDTYGFGPRAASMSGAMTAEADDFTAVFYNPARLVDRTQANVGVQFQWYRMVADVQSKNLSKPIDFSRAQPPDSIGTSFGFVFPLGGKVKDFLALGVGVFLPTPLLKLSSPSSSSPYWYRYDSNAERTNIYLGLGLRLVEGIKVGLGLQVLGDIVGNGTTLQVDLFGKQVQGADPNIQFISRAAPVFSTHISLIKRLRLGVTFKWEMKLDYRVPATVDLTGIGTLAFVVQGVAHYSPHSLRFGAAFDATDKLTVSLEGEWQNWSAAPSPYVHIEMDLTGPIIEGLGLGSAFDVTNVPPRPGFADTLGAKVAVEYRFAEWLVARAGGFLRPTPVPKQNTEGTNLLDNTALGASGGVSLRFDDPLEVFGHPIQFDLAGQAHFVLVREAIKDEFDPQPSYSYGANVYGLSVGLRYDF